MALKLEVESLDGVDESIQPLYKEVEGKYVLDVEGVPDVKGLKSAIEKERQTVKELKGTISKFSDVDLEKYNDLLTREAELLKHDPTEIEKMITGRVKKNDETWQSKFEELNNKLNEKDTKLSDLLISDELRKIGTELGVMEGEPMNDFVARGKNVFRLKDGVAVPMRDGEIVYGESGVEPLTMREFGKKLAETATHLFKSSSGGGAGTEGDGKARSGAVRSKADLKTDADKASYIGKHGRTAYLELPSEHTG